MDGFVGVPSYRVAAALAAAGPLALQRSGPFPPTRAPDRATAGSHNRTLYVLPGLFLGSKCLTASSFSHALDFAIALSLACWDNTPNVEAGGLMTRRQALAQNAMIGRSSSGRDTTRRVIPRTPSVLKNFWSGTQWRTFPSNRVASDGKKTARTHARKHTPRVVVVFFIFLSASRGSATDR